MHSRISARCFALLLTLFCVSCAINLNENLDSVGEISSAYWECNSVRFSPDSSQLAAVCGKDKFGDEHALILMFFDVETGQKSREVPFPPAAAERFARIVGQLHGYRDSLGFSYDGRLIGYAGPAVTEQAIIWDADSLERWPLPVPKKERSADKAIAFSPVDSILAIADAAGTIRAYDTDAAELVSELRPEGAGDRSNALLFSPKGRFLLAAIQKSSVLHGVRIWDWQAGKEIKFVEHETMIFGMDTDSEFQKIYTLNQGNRVNVLNVPEGLSQEVLGLSATGVEALADSWNENQFKFWASLCAASTALNPLNFALCMAVPPLQGIDYLDKRTMHERSESGYENGWAALPDMELSADGTRLVFLDDRAFRPSGGADQMVMVDTDNREVLWIKKAVKNGAPISDSSFSFVHAIDLSPDGKAVAVASAGIRLFDAETGEDLN